MSENVKFWHFSTKKYETLTVVIWLLHVQHVKINGRVVLPVPLPPFSVVEGVGDAVDVDAVGGFVVCLCSNLSIENIIILNSEILMKKVIKQVT